VGPIYVLIGPATFSSATNNAIKLRRILSAKLVGEPTAPAPDIAAPLRFADFLARSDPAQDTAIRSR